MQLHTYVVTAFGHIAGTVEPLKNTLIPKPLLYQPKCFTQTDVYHTKIQTKMCCHPVMVNVLSSEECLSMLKTESMKTFNKMYICTRKNEKYLQIKSKRQMAGEVK